MFLVHFILLIFLPLQKMKGAMVLLVITFSFSIASNSPGKKRYIIKEGDEVTLPCCEDIEVIECGMGVPWKVFIVLLLLFLVLLLLGCIKGLIGLCCPLVSIWGLAAMTGLEQSSMCFYETQFAGHPVICDCDELPYKSHAMAHSDHLYGRPAEFCLNVIFFLAYPIVLCCKCCKCLKKSDKGLCIRDCDPEKCYGSQLEEEDVRFVLEQLKRSRESFKRCMCDAAEQTPLLTDWDAPNQAFGSNRPRSRQNQMKPDEDDDYIPSHSDLSSNDVDEYELLEKKQMLQQLLNQ